MSVADYAGRTVDLLAFQGDFPSAGEQRVAMTLVPPGTGGLLTTGVQKLAQRFLIILLTRKGTVPYDPAFGTTFMTQAEKGLWRTPADVRRSFYSTRLDFMRQLRAAEREADPDDERVDQVNLIGIELGADRVGLRIHLITRAGPGYRFIAPLPVAVR